MESINNETQVINFLDTLFKSGFKFDGYITLDDNDEMLMDDSINVLDEVAMGVTYYLALYMVNNSLEVRIKYLIDDGGAGAVKILNYINEQNTLRKANA